MARDTICTECGHREDAHRGGDSACMICRICGFNNIHAPAGHPEQGCPHEYTDLCYCQRFEH